MKTPEKSKALTTWLVFVVSLVGGLIWLFSPLPPGGDTGWHSAVVGILAESIVNPYFDSNGGWGSYQAVYSLLSILSEFSDPMFAINVLIACSCSGLVWAAFALLKAANKEPAFSMLVLPAAYSTTLSFGFIAYLPSIALGVGVWASIWHIFNEPKKMGGWVALLLCWLGTCLAHPFAAVITLGGAMLLCLLLATRTRWKVWLGVVALLVIVSIPAVVSLSQVGHDAPEGVIPFLKRPGLSLWTKMTTQRFVTLWESIAAWPFRMIGFLSVVECYVVGFGTLAVAIVLRGRTVKSSRVDHRGRVAFFLFGCLFAVYCMTPYTFEWPRNWYGAQPRILPLVFVTLLVCLAPRQTSVRSTIGAAFIGLATALFFLLGPIADHNNEAADLRAVIDASSQNAKTLGLVETNQSIERGAAPFMRHATGYLVALKGGYGSALPMTVRDGMNTGHHIPVFLADDAPPAPPETWPGMPRRFNWEQHSKGWDQFLVRDYYSDTKHPYFIGLQNEVKCVAEAGHWRLFQKISSSSSMVPPQ